MRLKARYPCIHMYNNLGSILSDKFNALYVDIHNFHISF